MVDIPDGFKPDVRKRERAPIEGKRHTWQKHARAPGTRIDRATCKECGCMRDTESSKRSAGDSYGGPPIPETRYKPIDAIGWQTKRPPCVNTRQGNLFATRFDSDDPTPLETKSEPTIIPDAEYEENEEDQPSFKRRTPFGGPSKPIAVTVHVAPGIDVEHEISGDGIFASEWRWTIFVYAHRGLRIPNVQPRVINASTRDADIYAMSIAKHLPCVPGVWVICKRSDDGYLRTWEGDRGGWKFREKGERGE